MRRIPLALCLLACGAAGLAQAPAGLSADRLVRLDTAMERYVAGETVAGMVSLVLRDGRVVLERAHGWRDKERRVAMTPDTIFRIASQTKALTSVAALILMEEGRLGLADPVSRYIPAFAKLTVARSGEAGMTTVPARRAITVRDLLTHTAGFSYGTGRDVATLYAAQGLGPAAGAGWYLADKDEPVCTTMERLATLPLVAQPGEAWVYGYSTDVLGCVVERASGLSLDAYLRATIIDPLGMRDTHFYLPESKRDRLAVVYAGGAGGRVVRAPEGAHGQGHYVDGPRRSFSGGAGLVSTARDYARFLEMIRNGGALDGVRILSPRTVALLTTNQTGTLHSPNGLGWSLAFETTERVGANGLDGVGAYGWGGAYGSVYKVDPQSGLVMVFLMQLVPNSTDIRTRWPTLVYQALTDTR
jgi:CubicO group peptidase (beta-lactamase class C family)